MDGWMDGRVSIAVGVYSTFRISSRELFDFCMGGRVLSVVVLD